MIERQESNLGFGRRCLRYAMHLSRRQMPMRPEIYFATRDITVMTSHYRGRASI